MVQREELNIELLMAQGWFRGCITVPTGGRLLDYLNTKPSMIALTHVVDPSGASVPFLVVNSEQVIAVRLQSEE